MSGSNKEQIIQQFMYVSGLGFVESKRRGDTGIGKTFEDYMGVKENNSPGPDLLGYEIKTHAENSSSYTTLFTLAPKFLDEPKKRGANKYLRDNYGYDSKEGNNTLSLHTSMFANERNNMTDKANANQRYSFSLRYDQEKNFIRIQVFDKRSPNDKAIDESVGYTCDAIRKKLSQKIKKLLYVEADKRPINGKIHFHFKTATIYEEVKFEKFIEAMLNKKIMYDVRIGTYQTGKNIGKVHDHGSGFRMKECDLPSLFAYKHVIRGKKL